MYIYGIHVYVGNRTFNGSSGVAVRYMYIGDGMMYIAQ